MFLFQDQNYSVDKTKESLCIVLMTELHSISTKTIPIHTFVNLKAIIRQGVKNIKCNTRLITMRSKPDYVEFVLLQLLLMLLLCFLLLQLFIRGQLWLIKVYLILIEAITVVELASRPCLDLAFTLPDPLLALTLPSPCLHLAFKVQSKSCH